MLTTGLTLVVAQTTMRTMSTIKAEAPVHKPSLLSNNELRVLSQLSPAQLRMLYEQRKVDVNNPTYLNREKWMKHMQQRFQEVAGHEQMPPAPLPSAPLSHPRSNWRQSCSASAWRRLTPMSSLSQKGAPQCHRRLLTTSLPRRTTT